MHIFFPFFSYSHIGLTVLFHYHQGCYPLLFFLLLPSFLKCFFFSWSRLSRILFFPFFLYFLNCSFHYYQGYHVFLFLFCCPCFSFVLFYYNLGYHALLFFFSCPLLLNVPFFIIKLITHIFFPFSHIFFTAVFFSLSQRLSGFSFFYFAVLIFYLVSSTVM